MASLTFPAIGEKGYGENPRVPKIYKVTAGFTGTGADVILTGTGTYEIASIVPGDYILRCWVKVTTVFTTNVTLNIGYTGGDTNAVATEALIAPATDDDVLGIMASQSTAAATGIGAQYGLTDGIDVLVGVTAVLVGFMEIYFEHAHLDLI